jgi:hypothetical protein
MSDRLAGLLAGVRQREAIGEGRARGLIDVIGRLRRVAVAITTDRPEHGLAFEVTLFEV